MHTAPVPAVTSTPAAAEGALTTRAPVCWAHLTDGTVTVDRAHQALFSLLAARAIPLARPGDIVLLPAPGLELPQELEHLRSLGLGPNAEDIHWVACGQPDDGAVVGGTGVTDGLPITPGMRMETFSGTSQFVRDIAGHYGALLVAPALDPSNLVNSKAWLLELARERNLPVPEGMVVGSADEAKTVGEVLFARGKAALRFRPDHAASGIGHKVIVRDPDMTLREQLAGLMYSGVLQEQIAVEGDFSVQFYIDPKRPAAALQGPEFRILEIIQQVVGREGEYQGSVFPAQLPGGKLPDEFQLAIHRLLSAMAALGYWGYGCIDLMVDKRGNFWISEVNGRRTATFYGAMISRRLFGKQKTRPFVLRSFRIPKGMPFADFKEFMRPHLLAPGGEEGLIPFAYLPQEGFTYGVTFGETPERARVLDSVTCEAAKPLGR